MVSGDDLISEMRVNSIGEMFVAVVWIMMDLLDGVPFEFVTGGIITHCEIICGGLIPRLPPTLGENF
jgi:hypothetical protein